ncbi:MAG TPA: PAS domain S-box protein [Prolixibacteraceae bacterium]|nr:PAS domain S-box protein [Prolixibacteraceae bacterium]
MRYEEGVEKNVNGVSLSNDIVLVSNIHDHIQYIKASLASQLCSFIVTVDGNSAIQRINEKIPALVILDTTSDKEGYETCRLLKANHTTKHLPVLFIGSPDDPLLKLKAYAAGGNDVICKPFSKEEIQFKVNNHMQLFRMQSVLQLRNEQLEYELARSKAMELNLRKRITALTHPLEDATDIAFDHLFDVADLQKLQDQFADAFGVASLITDPEGNPITKPSNFSYLCQDLIRKTEKGMKNCMHSDAIIGCHNAAGPTVMHCLSGGLFDAGASITVGGRHVANWLIGQIRNDSTDTQRLHDYAREIGVDEQAFMEAYYKVTPMPLEKFNKIAEVLFTMATQLSLISYQNARQAQFINKKIQAEEALMESEERFRTILYSIGDGVITTDTEGRIKIMNQVAEQLTGWSQQEACGKPLEEVFNIINESTRALVEIPVRKVLREGVVVGLANHTVLIAKDGSEYPIADSGAPIRTDNGEIVGVVLIFRDQSVERKADHALRESEKRFKLLYENAPLSYQSLDHQARLIDVNPTWLKTLGYQREEVIGRPFGDFMTPESAELIKSRFNHFVKAGEIHDYQFEMVRKNGSKFLVSYEGRIAHNDDGQFKSTHCIFTDITQRQKAEDALKESESKFRSLFENSSVGISVTSIDGVLKINKAFADMLGYSPSEISNITWKEITHPGDIQMNIDYNNSMLNGEATSYRFEKRYIHRDGSIIWTDVNITLQRDENNQPVYFITSVNDITKRKQAEEAILNEKKLLRTLIDNLPVTIYVKDHEGRKMVANKADLEVIGASTEEQVLGKTDLETFNDEIGERGYLDDLKVLKSGNAVINREEVFLDNQGAQRWLVTSKIPIYDQTGIITGLVGIGRDITEQKKASETIQKFTKSIEQSPSTIVITDVYGTIEYVNPKFTEVTGYTPEEAIGQNPRILKSGLIASEVYKNMWDTIASGEVWRGEFQNKKKNGELYWEWVTMTSIKNEDGLITNYIAIKEDISARKKMEADLILAKEKAEENDRLKSAFLANMSHEIRTPLNSIIGFSELLSNPDYKLDDRYEFARIITDSGNNLLAILSDIMDISKIEAGQVEVRKNVFSAKSLIQDIYSEYRMKAFNKKIELQISPVLPADDILLNSDQTKIKQVLVNFIGNALKFTEKGTIKIGIEITGRFVQFNVIDTGIGIEEKYHSRIFERFRQVEGSLTRKYGGNGLGLAISKSLVELLGGTIGMKSEKGKGSHFYFILPDVIV